MRNLKLLSWIVGLPMLLLLVYVGWEQVRVARIESRQAEFKITLAAIFNPTFKAETPVRSEDITKDPRYGQTEPHFGMPKGHLPVKSYLAVPVVSRNGAVIGGLFFGHPDPAKFTERSERLIVGVAAQAAMPLITRGFMTGRNVKSRNASE